MIFFLFLTQRRYQLCESKTRRLSYFKRKTGIRISFFFSLITIKLVFSQFNIAVSVQWITRMSSFHSNPFLDRTTFGFSSNVYLTSGFNQRNLSKLHYRHKQFRPWVMSIMSYDTKLSYNIF